VEPFASDGCSFSVGPEHLFTMADGKEIEIKLGLPPSALAKVENAPQLRELAGKAETKRLVSLYFDTRKRKLRKTGISLRIRDDEERHIQTVKAEQAIDGSSFGRGEWETEVGGVNPDLDSAKQTPLAPLVTRKLRRSLKPIFETRVERKVFPLRSGGASIEAALDRGTIEADGKSAEICELELELKDGDPSELFHVAHRLSKRAPLELELRSKAERGYALVEGAKAGAVKADEVR
jgi:inorganic triphosphatase YgiF